MNAPTDGAESVTSRRRTKRDSRLVFSLSRVTVHLGLGGLALSWLLAFGLGRHTAPVEPHAPAPTVRTLALPAAPVPGRALEGLRPAARAATPTIAAAAATPPAPAPPKLNLYEQAPPDGFGIQIGAYPKREEAEAAIMAIASELDGLDVFVISVDIPGKGTWYRVRLGRFQTRQAAETRRGTLSVAEGALSVPYR